MTKPTIMTVVGTRPEIIRLSRLIPKFDEAFNHILIHTGQNYDRMLSDIFFQELQIRLPDEFLNIDHSSLGKSFGDLFIKFEESLIKYRPDGVFILGDTNSSLVAILAKRMQIPVYHWEAGNRSFDENVPEETNRRIVDHTSHFNIAYSKQAESNLLKEGIPSKRILMSGSPLREVLDFYKNHINRSSILQEVNLEKSKYFLASIHRQENVDDFQNLKKILDNLEKLSETFQLPIVFSVHPRTQKRLTSGKISLPDDKFILHNPFGFFDYIKLQQNAFCVLSDSGSVSEESAILRFPAVTLRKSMERQEALAAGSILMSSLEIGELIESVKKITHSQGEPPEEYTVSNASAAVLELVLSTVSTFESWSGVRKLHV